MNQQKKIINSFIHMTHLQYQKNIEDRKNFVKALEELENLKKDNSAYEQNVIQLTKNIYQFSKLGFVCGSGARHLRVWRIPQACCGLWSCSYRHHVHNGLIHGMDFPFAGAALQFRYCGHGLCA